MTSATSPSMRAVPGAGTAASAAAAAAAATTTTSSSSTLSPGVTAAAATSAALAPAVRAEAPPRAVARKAAAVQTDAHWQHLLAGTMAGVFSKSILQPLDLVKTRLQVQSSADAMSRPFYSGVGNAFKTIIRTEGVKALYTGLGPNLFGSGVSWGAYFYLYNCAKRYLSRTDEDGYTRKLNAADHLLSAAFAGVGTCLLTNPIWMIKTRLQLQFKQSASSRDYRSFCDAFKCIVRDEGWTALYRGLPTALTLVSNGALQFMAYEHIKRTIVDRIFDHDESQLGPHHFLAMGAVAKVFSSSATYPLQVTKSHLYKRRDGPHVKLTSLDIWKRIAKTDGVRGFYRGLMPQLMKTAPSSALTFLGYEEMMRLLRCLNQRE